jgi:hypothetical protein
MDTAGGTAIARRRAAIEGRIGRFAAIIPPRAGADMGAIAPIMPPSAFLTDPPFLSLSSTVGSVVIIFTIGLN